MTDLNEPVLHSLEHTKIPFFSKTLCCLSSLADLSNVIRADGGYWKIGLKHLFELIQNYFKLVKLHGAYGKDLYLYGFDITYVEIL